jgi:hypothetical protein
VPQRRPVVLRREQGVTQIWALYSLEVGEKENAAAGHAMCRRHCGRCSGLEEIS